MWVFQQLKRSNASYMFMKENVNEIELSLAMATRRLTKGAREKVFTSLCKLTETIPYFRNIKRRKKAVSRSLYASFIYHSSCHHNILLGLSFFVQGVEGEMDKNQWFLVIIFYYFLILLLIDQDEWWEGKGGEEN